LAVHPGLEFTEVVVEKNVPVYVVPDHRQNRPDAHWLVDCGWSTSSAADAEPGCSGSRRAVARTARAMTRGVFMSMKASVGATNLTDRGCDVRHVCWGRGG
jgi:hypothetical protein